MSATAEDVFYSLRDLVNLIRGIIRSSDGKLVVKHEEVPDPPEGKKINIHDSLLDFMEVLSKDTYNGFQIGGTINRLISFASDLVGALSSISSELGAIRVQQVTQGDYVQYAGSTSTHLQDMANDVSEIKTLMRCFVLSDSSGITNEMSSETIPLLVEELKVVRADNKALRDELLEVKKIVDNTSVTTTTQQGV